MDTDTSRAASRVSVSLRATHECSVCVPNTSSCDVAQPWAVQFEARAKWDSWTSRKGKYRIIFGPDFPHLSRWMVLRSCDFGRFLVRSLMVSLQTFACMPLPVCLCLCASACLCHGLHFAFQACPQRRLAASTSSAPTRFSPSTNKGQQSPFFYACVLVVVVLYARK